MIDNNNTKTNRYVFIRYLHMGEFTDSVNIYYLPQTVNSLVGETDTAVWWGRLRFVYTESHTPILCISSQFHFSDIKLAAWNQLQWEYLHYGNWQTLQFWAFY